MGILKIHFDAFVKRKKMPVAKTCKNTAKVKMDVNENTFWAGGFESEHQKSTNVSHSVRKFTDSMTLSY